MTIFSKIISGEIPCYKIAEDEKFFAFLDINPLAEGHTLVIPKLEIDNFFNLPRDYLQEIFLFARPVAKAIEKSFNFTRKKLNPSKDQLKAAQEKILNNL
jgi:histidine triad (HIT) family protein